MQGRKPISPHDRNLFKRVDRFVRIFRVLVGLALDPEGADYLPHRYRAAYYMGVDDVAKLPLKVFDIYRKPTS